MVEVRARRLDGLRRDEVAFALELAGPALELGGHAPQLLLLPFALGEVANDEDELVLGRVDDAAFEVAEAVAGLELDSTASLLPVSRARSARAISVAATERGRMSWTLEPMICSREVASIPGSSASTSR